MPPIPNTSLAKAEFIRSIVPQILALSVAMNFVLGVYFYKTAELLKLYRVECNPACTPLLEQKAGSPSMPQSLPNVRFRADAAYCGRVQGTDAVGLKAPDAVISGSRN